MMKIDVRGTWSGQFQSVVISEGAESLDTGLLNEAECNELAQKFLEAAKDLISAGDASDKISEAISELEKYQ